MERRYIVCTPVEIEVLTELLRDGAENHLIGARIYRATETIKTHMKRIMARAKVHNRTHLAISLVRGELVVINTGGQIHVFPAG